MRGAEALVPLLRHEPSTIDLDVSLGALPFEQEMIARARRHRLGRLSVPLPTPEDLIIMKAIAHRPRDFADIESILEANAGIDEVRIRDVVREFAAILEAPELSTDLERPALAPPAQGAATVDRHACEAATEARPLSKSADSTSSDSSVYAPRRSG